MPANLRYAGIKPNDTVDGIGITVSFWVLKGKIYVKK